MDIKKGHRQRLIDRFLKYPESLTDLEILEITLFYSIPRKDTKIISFNLFKQFKNLTNIFYINQNQLEESIGINKQTYIFFQVLKYFFLRLSKEKIKRENFLNSTEDIYKYFRILMTGKTHEELHLVFLDNRNKVIDIYLFSTGTINYVNVYIREIIKKSLNVGAVSLILVHNHPSGDPSPSNPDKILTNELKKICETIGINLMDHIIVTTNQYFSFLHNNLL